MADDNPIPSQETSLFPSEPRPTGRPVYESNLLPKRKRRRFSPWLIIPGLLLVLLAGYYVLVFGPKPRPNVVTAGIVVFASDQNSPGTAHLWTEKADGTGAAQQLTTGPAADTNPVFTADGKQLAFLSNRGGGPNQIWVVDGDGKNVVQITRTEGAKSSPKFAPGSNTLLGFLSGASLAVLNVGKSDASLLLPTPAASTHSSSTDPAQTQEASTAAVSFAWKPAADKSNPEGDGLGLAAVLETAGAQKLAVLPTLSSAPRLTQNDKPDGPPLAAADRLSLAYAPDGTKLAVGMLHVLGLPGDQKISGLILFDGNGNVQKPIVPPQRDTALGPQEPVYSPDGTQVVIELWRQTDLASRAVLGLFIVTADGTGTPHILAKGDAEAAQFSPDGKQIFFLARRADGGHDLVRINADATGPLRLSDGHADITSFALSPQAAPQ